MHSAPQAVAEPRAQQARDDEGEQQVEGDRAEAEPDRAVGETNGMTASSRPIGA